MHALPAQIQVAVLQAQFVLHAHLVADLEGRGLGLAQHPQLAHIQLHIAGGNLGGLGIPLTQQALGDHHIFAAQALGLGKHVPVGAVVKHQLQNAGGVPQVGKDDAAFVAALGDGAGHHHLLPGIGQAHLTAVAGAAQISHGFQSCNLPLSKGKGRSAAARIPAGFPARPRRLPSPDAEKMAPHAARPCFFYYSGFAPRWQGLPRGPQRFFAGFTGPRCSAECGRCPAPGLPRPQTWPAGRPPSCGRAPLPAHPARFARRSSSGCGCPAPGRCAYCG